MSGSGCSVVKGWLVGLRSLQILALLLASALAAVLLAGFAAMLDLAQYGEYPYTAMMPLAAAGVGVTTVSLAINLASAALCITWLVYTLAPARRAKASCCGNHESCITFRHDVGWDTAFAILYAINMIIGAVQGSGFVTVIISAVMMVLFIATAVLSSKMGKAAKEQLDAECRPMYALRPIHYGPTAGLAAPPKAVEVV